MTLSLSNSANLVKLDTIKNKSEGKVEIEWSRGMWTDCANVDSPVSLGLFEGENKSIYFRKSLPQLCM